MLIELNNKMVEIDDECVDLVLFFNKIGLKTKFSCQGHEPYEPFEIIFDDSVTDDQIIKFLSVNLNSYQHSNAIGKFAKWHRYMSGQLAINWIFTCRTIEWAKISYKRFTDDMTKYN